MFLGALATHFSILQLDRLLSMNSVVTVNLRIKAGKMVIQIYKYNNQILLAYIPILQNETKLPLCIVIAFSVM